MKKLLICGCLLAMVLTLLLGTSAYAAGEITITQQPENISAAIGQKGTATVVASADSALSYQWYFKGVNSSTWQVSGMSGAKTSTITVPVTQARLGQQYKCVITSAAGNSIETEAVRVVNANASVVTINRQPADIRAHIGENGTASVEVSCNTSAVLNYQWYFKGVNSSTWQVSGMSGAKTATITVPVTKARIGQQYKCIITTADGGRAESEAVTILEPLPSVITIDRQPADIQVHIGENGTATVEASTDTGAALSYRWYFKSVNSSTWQASGMSGAKTATITVPVIKARIGQQYKCIITTADGGRVESDVVTILEPVPSVISIDTQPADIYAFFNENGTATVEASADTGAALSYRWYFKSAKGSTWQASGMSGAKTATITVPVIKARVGQQYKCVITTADGGRIETEPATVYEKPVLSLTVTRNPDSYRTYTGEPVELDVSVSVDTKQYPMSFQWYKDGEKLEGATESRLYFASVTEEDAGSYTCEISGYGYTASSMTGTVDVLG